MKAGRLIPGLPDCVALHCLLHLPFHAIPVARAVCKRWNRELASPSFYHLRSATGLAPRIVMLLFRAKLSHTVGKLHVALYEPATDICIICRLAATRSNKYVWSRSAIFGRELVVIVGWDVLKKWRTGKVHIYDIVTGAWRTGAPLPAPEQPLRSCRFGLKEGKVFVVGEIDAKGKKQQSALIYDVAIDTWLEVPDLERNTCQGRLCDEFWRRNGEYNRAIEWCKNLLSLNDEKRYLSLNVMTMDDKEIILMRFPRKRSNGNVETEEFTLSAPFLKILRRQLGLRPNEIAQYLECFFSCHL